jgi:hypothetical protein
MNMIDFDDIKSWFGRMWPIRTKARASSSVTLGLSMKTQKSVLGKSLPNEPHQIHQRWGRVQEGDQAQSSVLRIAEGLTGHR